jgi:hypothetical protein
MYYNYKPNNDPVIVMREYIKYFLCIAENFSQTTFSYTLVTFRVLTY